MITITLTEKQLRVLNSTLYRAYRTIGIDADEQKSIGALIDEIGEQTECALVDADAAAARLDALLNAAHEAEAVLEKLLAEENA